MYWVVLATSALTFNSIILALLEACRHQGSQIQVFTFGCQRCTSLFNLARMEHFEFIGISFAHLL